MGGHRNYQAEGRSLKNFQVSAQVLNLCHEEGNRNEETKVLKSKCEVKGKVRGGKKCGDRS